MFIIYLVSASFYDDDWSGSLAVFGSFELISEIANILWHYMKDYWSESESRSSANVYFAIKSKDGFWSPAR